MATDRLDDSDGLPHFPDRLNRLCESVAWREGGAVRVTSNTLLTEGVTALGCPVSEGYVSMMRRGLRSNPSARLLSAITAFFNDRTPVDIPVTYFYDPYVTASVDRLLDLRFETLLGETR